MVNWEAHHYNINIYNLTINISIQHYLEENWLQFSNYNVVLQLPESG